MMVSDVRLLGKAAHMDFVEAAAEIADCPDNLG